MVDTQVQARTTITEADLLRLEGQHYTRYEVVDGELVEAAMPPRHLHIHVITNLLRVVDPFVVANKLGYFYPDGLHCVLHVDEESGLRVVRIPDSAFIRRERVKSDHDWSRLFYGAPDLAVEVFSPGEGGVIQDKIADYFTYGTEEVWVIYPEHRLLHQYHRDEPGLVRVYNEAQTFSAESLFPGLTITLADLFKLALTD